MPIERRIREGAERNAGVLDPDVDRFLDSVVRKTRRRHVIHRSLTVAASAAALVVVIVVGPGVLDGIGGDGGAVPGTNPTPSVGPSVPPSAPLLTGTFIRTIPGGTAVVRNSGIAGTWTLAAGSDGNVRLLAPDSFAPGDPPGTFDVQTDSLQTDVFGANMCEGLPAGSYTWTQQAGFLSLTVLSDPCDARVVVLAAGPWESGS